MPEAPGDRHWLLGLVLDISGGAQKPEGTIVRSEASKQHNGRTKGNVRLVASSRLTIGAGDALALPVDQVAADRIVPIARRRRKLPICFVQREGKKVGLRLLGPVDSCLPGRNALATRSSSFSELIKR